MDNPPGTQTQAAPARADDAGWRLPDWGICLLLLLLAVSLRLTHLGFPLDSDGADYARAAARGFVANYTDRGSQPTSEFLLEGLTDFLVRADVDLLRKGYEQGDIHVLRHLHAPLLIYFLQLSGALFGDSEVALRLTPLLFGSLLAPLLFLGCAHTLPRNGRFAGVCAAVLAAGTPLLGEISKYVSYHALFAVFGMAALFLTMKALQTERNRFLYLGAACFALALLTLEYAAVLLFALVASFLLIRNPWLRVTWGEIRVSTRLLVALLVVAATILAVWPAGILKLNFLKNYVTYSKPVLTLLQRAVSHVPSLGGEGAAPWYSVYTKFFAANPILGVLTALLMADLIYGMVRRRYQTALLPVWIYLLGFFVVNLQIDFFKGYYMAHMLPPMFVLMGSTLGSIWAARRGSLRWLPVALLGLHITISLPAMLRAHTGKPPTRTATDFLEARADEGSRIMVAPDALAPVFSYYLPRQEVMFFRSEPDDHEETLRALTAGEVDFFVFRGKPALLERLYIHAALEEHFELLATFTDDYDDRLLLIFGVASATAARMRDR